MVRSSHLGAPQCTDAATSAAPAGGYFIINGTERVVVSQDRMPENRPFMYSTSRLWRTATPRKCRDSSYDFGVNHHTAHRLKPNQLGRFVPSPCTVNANIPLFVCSER
jgi:DNA-directed RNA polymerase beta subunit